MLVFKIVTTDKAKIASVQFFLALLYGLHSLYGYVHIYSVSIYDND